MLWKLLIEKKLAFWAPLIMLMIGVVLYSYILPARYNKVIGLLDWLFSGSDTIIATLRSADIVLGQAYRIAITKCIVWLWTLGFLISCYICGYAWQHCDRMKPNSLAKIDVSWKSDFQEVVIHMRDLKKTCNDDGIRKFYHIVRNIEEQFEGIHDFGYGDEEVSVVEKEICQNIRALKHEVFLVTDADLFNSRQQVLLRYCSQIQNDLRKRNELKKISG